MDNCCENHGADHVHDHTELDDKTDEKPVKIDPGQSRIPEKDGVEYVFTNFDPSNEERAAYVAYAKAKYGAPLKGVEFTAVKEADGSDFVDLKVRLRQDGFQRIRRITGYLVGTIDRFNDAKRHEEHDRVKHAMSSLAHEHTIGQI
jgi:hypothetical protein